jgi:Holliday junction resolvasome RuvABC ATP-dependent DNA helicase subunit
LATDQPSDVVDALHKRMEIEVPIQKYSETEFRWIAARTATKIGILLTGQAYSAVARASFGQPRKTKHLLQKLARHYHEKVSKKEDIGQKDVVAYLDEEGTDEWGLGRTAQAYMLTLAHLKHASLCQIGRQCGTDVRHVEHKIEPHLINLSYINITSRGRELTIKGAGWVARAEERRRAKRKAARKNKDNKNTENTENSVENRHEVN